MIINHSIIFFIDKYGSEEQIHGTHHYETTEVKNTAKQLLYLKELKFLKITSIEFYDVILEDIQRFPRLTTEVTNYDYENKIEDKKRNIYVLKQDYLNVILNDME